MNKCYYIVEEYHDPYANPSVKTAWYAVCLTKEIAIRELQNIKNSLIKNKFLNYDYDLVEYADDNFKINWIASGCQRKYFIFEINFFDK